MKMRQQVDVDLEELDQIIDRGTRAPLSESEGQKLKAVIHAMAEKLVRKRNTEKTSAVLPPDAAPADKPEAGESARPATGAMAPLRLPAPAGFVSRTPRSTPATGAQSA